MLKKNLLKLSTFFLLFFTLFNPTVSADLISSGFKQLGFCYQISNIDDFSEYAFVLLEGRSPDWEILERGDCVGFYKLGDANFYAIPRGKFNQSVFEENFDAAWEQVDSIGILADYKPRSYGQVPEANPLRSIETVLEIVAVDASGLQIKEVEKIEHYESVEDYVVSKGFLVALLLTIFLEFMVYLILLKTRKKPWGLFKKTVLIQVATQPVASFIFALFLTSGWSKSHMIPFIVVELGVVVIEIFLIKWLFKLSNKKAILVSFLANLVSALVSGLIIFL